MPQVQVLAVITAKPGMRDQILAAYRDNVAAVHADDGCIAYEAVARSQICLIPGDGNMRG